VAPLSSYFPISSSSFFSLYSRPSLITFFIYLKSL
jgi:hypothetical protein